MLAAMRREAGHDLLVNDREALLEQRLDHACSGREGSDTAVRVRAQPGPHIFQTAATLRLREADQLIERCALDHGLEGCVRCDGPWSPECTVPVALVDHSNPHGRSTHIHTPDYMFGCVTKLSVHGFAYMP